MKRLINLFTGNNHMVLFRAILSTQLSSFRPTTQLSTVRRASNSPCLSVTIQGAETWGLNQGCAELLLCSVRAQSPSTSTDVSNKGDRCVQTSSYFTACSVIGQKCTCLVPCLSASWCIKKICWSPKSLLYSSTLKKKKNTHADFCWLICVI